MDKNKSYEVVILDNVCSDGKENTLEMIKDIINDGKGIILQFEKSQLYSKDAEFVSFVRQNSDLNIKKIFEKVYVITENLG